MFTRSDFVSGFERELKPDTRSFNLTSFLGEDTELPSRVDLREFCSPRIRQRNGSCVSQALVNALELLRIREKGLDAHVDLSPMYLYYRSREQWHPSLVTEDCGSYVSHGCKTLLRAGVCPSKYHGDRKSFDEKPSLVATQEAWLHRIKSYYKIWEEGEERVYAVKKALAAGYPVVYGTYITNDWFSYAKQKIIQPPKDINTVIGGHATCIVGYGPGYAEGTFIGENSWGSSWGDAGFYYMSEKVVSSESSHDFWVITDNRPVTTEA